VVAEQLSPLLLYDDDLEARVGRLPKRQRRDIDSAVKKQEEAPDPKRLFSV
jgi:hypothetical protein